MVRFDGVKPDHYNQEKAFLYVFNSGIYFKVGVARDIEKRLTVLQIANPHGIELVMYRSVDKVDVFLVEKEAHRILSQYSHRNEWFITDFANISSAVSKAMQHARVLRKSRLRKEIRRVRDAYKTAVVA